MPPPQSRHMTFIVQRLAMYDKPTDVEVIKDDLSFEIMRQSVQTYDPTS